MNFFIYTFGCKVNSFDSAAMARVLEESGHRPAISELDAGLVIVNSCTVTEGGDKKVRQYLRRVRRENPAAVLVLAGCLPQAFPQDAAALSGVDIVMGTGNRGELARLVAEFEETRKRAVSIRGGAHRTFEELDADVVEGHTRAFLKIEEGCDRSCAYCVVPRARGSVVSLPVDAVARQAAALAQRGYREIVLTGINLSSYGRGESADLADAAAAVAAVPDVTRVRLGSLEPDLLPDGMLRRLAAIDGLCPQFHLSLQSGCDDTLRRMGRPYTAAGYRAVTERIRAQFDRPTFTTDMIVGFPGETQADFDESAAFAEAIGFLKIHVFPYSPRGGTRAASFDGQVARAEKNRRAAALSRLAQESRVRVLESFSGARARVILEQPVEGGFSGYTDRYLPALVTGTGLQTGDCAEGMITEIRGERCVVTTR